MLDSESEVGRENNNLCAGREEVIVSLWGIVIFLLLFTVTSNMVVCLGSTIFSGNGFVQ